MWARPESAEEEAWEDASDNQKILRISRLSPILLMLRCDKDVDLSQ